MISKSKSCSRSMRKIVFAGLLLWIAAVPGGAWGKQIVLKVVGPNGEALAIAEVYQYYSMHDEQPCGKEKKYVCDKKGLVRLPEDEVFQYEWQRKGVVLYGLYEDKLAGFADVNADDLDKEVELKLTPACRVYGKLKSTELDNLGQKVEWANVYVCRENNRPLSYSGRRGRFEFLLPSGEYRLDAYGTRLYPKQEEVEVKIGQKELEINLDLLADRLAYLIGKEAPELQQIKGWINSEPIKLADLRGKVVLLDFWGTWCGPCVGAIPKLIDLHEKYHNKGLVIIGIHDDSIKSMKELNEKLSGLSEKRWDGKEIPFVVALDGGGNCKIEGTKLTVRGATTAAYGIQSFPTMVLIDKEGKVVKEYNRGEDTDVLEKLLAADIDNKPYSEPNHLSKNLEPLKPEVVQSKSKCVLCGFITDSRTGRPVTDATVNIEYRYNAETDANGFYCLEKIHQDGNYRIGIDSNEYVGIYDYAAMPIVNLSGSKQVVKDFKLDRACMIEVRVVDEEGKPVEGAELLATSLGDERRTEIGGQMRRKRTNKDGILLLGDFPPSKTSYLITATHSTDITSLRKNGLGLIRRHWDYAPGKLVVTLTNPEVVESGKIVLQKGVDVNGCAQYEDGVPAADLQISAYPDWWHSNYCPEDYPIDANGHFTLRNITPGIYQIQVLIPAGSGSSMGINVLQTKLPLPNDELIMVKIPQKSPQSLASICGRLTFAGDKVPNYVDISASSIDGKYHSSTMWNNYRRDACDTNFVIDRLEPGKYKLTFSAPDLGQKVVENVEAPSEGLQVELVYCSKPYLTGTVLNSQTNQPIHQFKARVKKIQTLRGSNYTQSDQWFEFDDAEGRFNIEAVGPGIYQIQIAAEGFAWARSEDVNTDQNVPVVIKLSAGGGIKGRIVNEAGQPVNGAKVLPLSKAGGVTVGMMAYTREPFVSEDGAVETVDGAFELKHLSAGKESIKVVHSGYAYSVVSDIEVKENQTMEGIEVVLHKGGTAEGYVYDARGQPQSNVTLYFQNDAGYSSPAEEKTGRLATVTTDANGFYRVGGLPEQLCYVRRQGEWSSMGVACRAFVPANGKVSRLDFGGRPAVMGRVIIDGIPLANHKVELSVINMPHSPIFHCYAMTGPDGGFTFGGIPKGKWSVYYEDSEKRNNWIKIATVDTAGQNTDLGVIPAGLKTVRISIEYEQGAPKWGITQAFLQEGNRPWSQPMAEMSKPTDENEPYIVRNVLPGEHCLVLIRQDFVTLRHPIEVTENDVNIIVQMPKCTSGIHGRLTGKFSGQTLWRKDKTVVGYIRPDANSNYKLDNLPAGEYRLGGNMLIDSAALLEFELAEGEQKVLDIDVPSTPASQIGSLQVMVLDENGVPITGADVQLEGDAGVIEPMASFGQGFYFIAKPGPYTLHAKFAGYKKARQQVSIEILDLQKIKHAPNPVLLRLEKTVE